MLVVLVVVLLYMLVPMFIWLFYLLDPFRAYMLQKSGDALLDACNMIWS